VHAPSLGAPPAPPKPETDDIVRTVLQALEPVMVQRLAEEAETLVRLLVQEQMEALHARLRQELEALVRQAVSETIASGEKSS
jgi:hypothetical protein